MTDDADAVGFDRFREMVVSAVTASEIAARFDQLHRRTAALAIHTLAPPDIVTRALTRARTVYCGTKAVRLSLTMTEYVVPERKSLPTLMFNSYEP